MKEGWKWWGAGEKVNLRAPCGETHEFRLRDGLFRYAPCGEVLSHSGEYAGVGEPSAPSANKGARKTRMPGKALMMLMLAMCLGALACGPNSGKPELREVLMELGAARQRRAPRLSPKEREVLVASLATIRSLVFMKGNDSDCLSAVDISTAFLQSDLYPASDPPRYVCYKPHKYAEVEYYQLLGSIYGQRSAPLAFYKTLAGWLTAPREKGGGGFSAVSNDSFVALTENPGHAYNACVTGAGMVKGSNEPCCFVRDDGLRVVSWVDDLICRGSELQMKEFYSELRARFDIKDPAYLTPTSKLSFVGMEIEVERTSMGDRFSMHQNVALQHFLDSVDVGANPNIKCPMPDAKCLYDDVTPLDGVQAQWYQQMVGALNYFACTTRYDISHAVSRLGQCNNNPTVSSRRTLVRVLQYLRNNAEFSLEGVPRNTIVVDDVQYYCDSDHSGDKKYTTRSHTGIMIMLNSAPVHWCSKKQVSTAISSAMADIYALSEAVRHARYYAWRVAELGISITWPLVVQVDNQQAITFSKGTCVSSRLGGCVDVRAAVVKMLLHSFQMCCVL